MGARGQKHCDNLRTIHLSCSLESFLGFMDQTFPSFNFCLQNKANEDTGGDQGWGSNSFRDHCVVRIRYKLGVLLSSCLYCVHFILEIGRPQMHGPVKSIIRREPASTFLELKCYW